MMYGAQEQAGYEYQLNIKFGPYQQHLLNVPAKSGDDLLAKADFIAKNAHFLHWVASEIEAGGSGETSPEQAEANIRNEFQGSSEVNRGVVQPSGSTSNRADVPSCRHGVMKFMTGVSKKNNEPYKAYFCQGPRNVASDPQCAARFVD